MGFNKGYVHPQLECIGGIEFPCCQLSCRLPKWEAKTIHEISFVPSVLKTLEEDLKQQPVYQDSPKDALSDFSQEIKLAISFAPNQDLQDIPEQLQLGKIVHYTPQTGQMYDAFCLQALSVVLRFATTTPSLRPSLANLFFVEVRH
ncbi:uncharacterized protein TNCV_1150871 [Trichonephila clavipes]|nr:uncharacterized protein TNCV_1150871 [Trichonephila clavipes]